MSKFTKKVLESMTLFNLDPASYVFDITTISIDEKLSDFIIGLLMVSYHSKSISHEEAVKFNVPFTSDLCLCKFAQGYGHPFTDQARNAVQCQKVALHRNQHNLFQSIASTETVMMLGDFKC